MRGKESIALDLKHPDGLFIAFALIKRADVLIDPYRPGVCERLGLGPETCLKENPGLIFGRITGWGQDGPLANAPGHDIGYLSISGALHAMGEDGGKPQIPLNMIADMGGGGMLLLSGILAALLERHQSGKGQVIDAAMVDGSIQQLLTIHEMIANGKWNQHQRGVNLLDGGAHHYNVYECSDGKYISICALENKFHACLMNSLGLDEHADLNQDEATGWPALRNQIAALVKTRSRDEWCDLLEGTDACISPVLDLQEAPAHPANQARSSYIEMDNILQAAPAPRFSRSESKIQHGAPMPGEHAKSILLELDVASAKIDDLQQSGTIFIPELDSGL